MLYEIAEACRSQVQCGPIGRFFKVLGEKVSCKSCPNEWPTIWNILKKYHTWVKSSVFNFGQLNAKFGRLLFQVLVTLGHSQRTRKTLEPSATSSSIKNWNRIFVFWKRPSEIPIGRSFVRRWSLEFKTWPLVRYSPVWPDWPMSWQLIQWQNYSINLATFWGI